MFHQVHACKAQHSGDTCCVYPHIRTYVDHVMEESRVLYKSDSCQVLDVIYIFFIYHLPIEFQYEMMKVSSSSAFYKHEKARSGPRDWLSV